MTDPHLDMTLKVCIFGETGVGKTTLTSRYLTGIFNLDIRSTIGASIFVKHLNIRGLRIALQIWDFGGDKEYQYFLPIYGIGSSAGIFMFDLTKFSSLKSVDHWLSSFYEGLEDEAKGVPIFLIGGKSDLESEREVSEEDAYFQLKKNKMYKYFQTSAKSGDNISELFESIIEKLLIKSDIK